MMNMTYLTFVLLGLTICAVWVPPLKTHTHKSIRLWPFLYLACIASGLLQGFITWMALPWLISLAIAAALTAHSRTTTLQRSVYGSITAMLALALAIHVLPGFNNPLLIRCFRSRPAFKVPYIARDLRLGKITKVESRYW